MKFNFTQDELALLHGLCNRILEHAAAGKDKDGGAAMKAFARLRYKFTPNAHTVYLKASEASTLTKFASMVISTTKVPGKSVEVAQTIIDKLNP